MATETILIIGTIVAGIGIVFYLLNQKLTQLAASGKDDEAMKVMSSWMKQTLDQVQQTRQEMQKQLDFSGKAVNERLDNAARVIGKVSKELGEMSEIGRQMKDLQDFLKSPKLRGNIGEQVLKELLGQMLPKQSFHLQYSFKTGSVVDAAIKPPTALFRLTPSSRWKVFGG